MACTKTIEVSIVKGETVMFLGTAQNTLAFPPQFVGRMMEATVENFELEDVDHTCLNDLHLYGHCTFSFGPDWAYRVSARVTYPQDKKDVK